MVALGRPPGQILIESLHGAPKDGDADSGAVGFRERGVQPQRDGRPGWIPRSTPSSIEWARDTAAAIEPWSVDAAATSTTCRRTSRSSASAPRSATSAFARLQELKTRYDPDNVLRRNQNVPPA